MLSPQNEISVLRKFAKFYERLAGEGKTKVPPSKISFTIKSNEDKLVKQASRRAALQKLTNKPALKKVAFDTRNIDQETQRNPRENLQYWHRSDPFITKEVQDKIDVYAKLMNVLDNIKEEYGTEPEYHSSYARVLHDNVSRILRIKQADNNIFEPQLAYLEQLLFTRYRLTTEEISKAGELKLKKAILSKDEPLQKRGIFIRNTEASEPKQEQIVIDGRQKNMQQGLVEAIFGGNNQLRREGEKIVERSITITIRDEVKD